MPQLIGSPLNPIIIGTAFGPLQRDRFVFGQDNWCQPSAGAHWPLDHLTLSNDCHRDSRCAAPYLATTGAVAVLASSSGPRHFAFILS